MIEKHASAQRLREFTADLCVIGAGLVGIITTLALADRGFRVVLLESGWSRPRPEVQALSEAHNLRPDNHHAPHITVARRLGGTSNLWGGRCVPHDPIDFQPRPWLGLGAWPLDATVLAPCLGTACAALDAGRPIFHEALPG